MIWITIKIHVGSLDAHGERHSIGGLLHGHYPHHAKRLL